ncbi:MAG: UDP-N-acetylmuramate dehydrogenase, partial [Firmicutes bacterium]|nr:UDP-N-acetylmuramate dehydrogenase [Bacillota bacterium]
MSSAMYEFIKAYVPREDILLNEPMSKHTTFRVGGEASCFIRISDVGQLAALIPYLKMVEIPYFILGNGSNLLVGDKGYEGVILQIGSKMNRIQVEDTRIKVGAGVLLSQIARCAQENGLTGLEFASGIPGTIGGAVVMNAGAYGGEMKDILSGVRVLTKTGEIKVRPADELDLSYRHSRMMDEEEIVLEARLNLVQGSEAVIRAKMDELRKKRTEKQPLDYPSAGSTFKRPEGYFAGKLIEEAGLRGFRVGDAQVSEKHCGFVINRGEATAAQILELMRQVQERVKENSGV